MLESFFRFDQQRQNWYLNLGSLIVLKYIGNADLEVWKVKAQVILPTESCPAAAAFTFIHFASFKLSD